MQHWAADGNAGTPAFTEAVNTAISVKADKQSLMVSTMLDRTTIFTPNIAQHGDALMLLRSLPDGVAPLTWFDPQHRSTLDRLKFGNEGERQRGRAQLPAMSEEYIDTCCIEITRVLRPSGYLALWTDTYRLVEGHHLRIPRAALAPVDLIA